MKYLLELETAINDIIPIQKISRKVESIQRAMEIIERLRSFDRYGEPLKVKATIYELQKIKEVGNDKE